MNDENCKSDTPARTWIADAREKLRTAQRGRGAGRKSPAIDPIYDEVYSRGAQQIEALAEAGDPVALAFVNAPVVEGEPEPNEPPITDLRGEEFISHEVLLQKLLDRAKVEHAALLAEIQRLRTRDARIPSLDQLDALLTKYRAESHGEPIDLLGATQTAEARAEAAREHRDPSVRRHLLLDCAAWALAAVCEIDGAQTSASVVVEREANDAGGGP